MSGNQPYAGGYYGGFVPLTGGGSHLLVCDDFSDGVINTNVWRKATCATEQSGYIEVNQNTEGKDCVLESYPFYMHNGIKINIESYADPDQNKEYAKGRLALYRERDGKMIARLAWVDADYYDDEFRDAPIQDLILEIYDDNGGEKAYTIQSLQDSVWQTISLSIDFAAGSVIVDVDGTQTTHTSEFIKTFAGAEAYIKANPFGWETGHLLRFKKICAETIGNTVELPDTLKHADCVV